jgi:hypothetical protein
MAVRVRPRWHVTGAVTVLVLAACAGNPDLPAAGPMPTDPAGSPTDTESPSVPTNPSEPDFPTPTPEGTGPETPRPTRDNIVAIDIPGPPIGADDNVFDEELTSQCIGVVFSEGFGEDAQVESVSVGTKDAFVRDNAACDGDPLPTCDGFIFPADRGDRCSVGVTWLPGSGASRGSLALTFSAICHSRAVRFCDAPGVPPSGAPVRFTSGLELIADVSGLTPKATPSDHNSGDNVPTDDPSDSGSSEDGASSTDPTDDPESGE